MGRLDGKAAVVTGASSGIGRAIAKRFEAEGATVVGGSRRTGFDVRNEADVRRLFAKSKRVDIAVANAGIWAGGRIEHTKTRDWDDVVATNLTGVFYTAREAFKKMKRRGGTILIISSVAGTDAWEGTGSYSATKFGVRGLARAMADEGRKHGIRVSCICPGLVATPMAGRQPKGTPMIAAEDVAEAALYLATLGPNVMVHDLILDRLTTD